MIRNRLTKQFFLQDPISCAKLLLGKKFIVNDKSLIITETEGYLGPEDLASHARFGKTTRTDPLFHAGGILYVFVVYGLHYCTNFVMGEENQPGAVLLRAGKTEEGILVKGPGKFSAYLGIDKTYNYTDIVTNPNCYIFDAPPAKNIQKGERIGVGYAKQWAHKLYRFWII